MGGWNERVPNGPKALPRKKQAGTGEDLSTGMVNGPGQGRLPGQVMFCTRVDQGLPAGLASSAWAASSLREEVTGKVLLVA